MRLIATAFDRNDEVILQKERYVESWTFSWEDVIKDMVKDTAREADTPFRELESKPKVEAEPQPSFAEAMAPSISRLIHHEPKPRPILPWDRIVLEVRR